MWPKHEGNNLAVAASWVSVLNGQRLANVGQKPVFIQCNRQRGQPIQSVHSPLSLCQSLFIIPHSCPPVPLWPPSIYLCTSQESHWLWEEQRTMGDKVSGRQYVSFVLPWLYLQPRWQGIQNVSWTCTLQHLFRAQINIIIIIHRDR